MTSMKASAKTSVLSEDDLTDLTIAQLRAIAEENGYTITKTKKADIIAEILEQQ